ncbi:hypothetical protein M3212_12310 [Alkalihalobacillus oceani]|uniref:hypothetical protein n=1 Tax=Halalkalibacter oceani TaxID=1653776 RepID=UPI00203E097A|nr:hypothetical protein [Halalkalibacter oceani]MCM3761569.1 hypothetical protein [Halalkalibacter oceani]
MTWFIGIALALLAIIWLAMEVATSGDSGKGIRSYVTSFKKSLLFVIPLFAIGGVIYYMFF